MAKYRYFELTGESLELYLEAEEREMAFRADVRDKLEKKGVEEWVGHPNSGDPIAFVAEEKPEGCRLFKWNGKTPYPNMWEPYKGKRGGEWREFLDSLMKPDDCKSQDILIKHLSLPMWVPISKPSPRGHGVVALNSAVGHAGDKVFVRVPTEVRNWEPHEDMKEVKEWEFMKCKEEAEEYEEPCYTL